MNNRFLFAFFMLGCLLFTAFWQLEIVYIVATNPLGWGYNFGGLGDFGWELYTWRDFWYGVIFAVFILMFVMHKKSKKRR